MFATGSVFPEFNRIEYNKERKNKVLARVPCRNLVLLVASLSFCGHTELAMPAAAASSSLYQLPDFQMPLPENRGTTVRNLQAFQVRYLTIPANDNGRGVI